ncbi:MAG: HEAT repeat domain-containing protein, partial [Elusimicrobiaceae bacterium]
MKKAIALAGFFAIASPLLAQIPDNAFFEGPHYKQETERTQPIAPAPAKSEPRKEVKPITAKGEKPAQPTENIVFLKPVQLSSSGYTQLSGEENSERLIKFLEHENPQLRAEAALELGKRQYLAAVPVLINMLTDDSKIVSDAAETALAGYREKSVTAVLTDKLYDGDEKL